MMAKTLALHGCRVYIASRKQAVVDATAAGINKLDGVGKSGGKVVALQADLANKAACDKLASQVAELEGGSTKAKLHVLINCSGITWGSSLETYPEEQGWRKVLQVNVISTYYVTIACLPMLRRAADGSRDPARVINLGSSLGHMVQGTGYPMSGPGAVSIACWLNTRDSDKLDVENSHSFPFKPRDDASKAAIAHMTRGLALDLAPQHIAVNNLAPGVFPSRMSKHSIDTAEQILKEETMLGGLILEFRWTHAVVLLRATAGNG